MASFSEWILEFFYDPVMVESSDNEVTNKVDMKHIGPLFHIIYM